MGKNSFVIGITEKYPKELLQGRVNVEANVIGCLMKDILYFDDVKLTKDNFITKDGRFLFTLVKYIRDKGFNSFDEVTILSTLSEDSIETLNEFGGWDSIQNMIDVINDSNFEIYLDNLYRENTIISLFDNGFNLFKEVEFNDKMIKPIVLFRKMTSEMVLDFYETKLTTLGYSDSKKVLEEEDLDFDDEFIDSSEEGLESGVPFDMAGIDVEGGEMNCFPFFSNQIDGLAHGTMSMFGGYSSVGKTTYLTSVIMGIIYRGEKVLIISNEQKAKVFKTSFLIWILYKHFRYYKITKKKFRSGERTDEDREMIKKAQTYWREHYFKKIKFISIEDADMGIVKKKVRENVLKEGYSAFLYDTFKLQTENSGNDKEYIALVKDSKELHKLARKYDLIGLATIQLAAHTIGKLFLDVSVLSNSKQVKEILEGLFLMRIVYPEELDPGNKKYYCHPFQLKKENDKWIEKEYRLDPNGTYRFLFVDKTRTGQNSGDNGCAYCYRFDGNHGIFKEICMVRPRHGTIV